MASAPLPHKPTGGSTWRGARVKFAPAAPHSLDFADSSAHEEMRKVVKRPAFSKFMHTSMDAPQAHSSSDNPLSGSVPLVGRRVGNRVIATPAEDLVAVNTNPSKFADQRYEKMTDAATILRGTKVISIPITPDGLH